MLAYQGTLVYRNGTQVIPHATATNMAWNAETHDVGDYHDTSFVNSQVLVPTDLGGTYNIYAAVEWESNATGYRWVQILVNDAAIARTTGPTIAGYSLLQFVSTSYILTEGDRVTVQVYQTSTAGLDITGNGYNTIFGVDLLGIQK